MQKVFITGISGFLGSFLQSHWQNKFNLFGSYFSKVPDNEKQCFKVNITDTDNMFAVLDEVKPDIVLHTAAISSIAACDADYELAYNVNVNATIALAKYCNSNNIQFIFCSTDLVFDGKKGNYSEQDLPNPINSYGKLKFAAEQALLFSNKNACIARLPLLVGENTKGLAGVIADLQHKAATQQITLLFTDEYRSPAWLGDVASGFECIIENKIAGITHIAGANKYSRYELGLKIKTLYNLLQLQIEPTTHAAQKITNRPANCSMLYKRLAQFGFKHSKNF
jgi:dTDP-4-dehydrorhamnose reductase